MEGIDKVQHERDLIRRVQLNDDRMAMNELIRLYRGTINNSIDASGIYQVMDRNTAKEHAINIFKDIIKRKYDLNYTNKPITPITGWLRDELKKIKEENRNIIGRKSAELSRKEATVNSKFRALLERQLGRDPTNQELFEYIKKNTDLGKDLQIKNLDRIDTMRRRELSGDQFLNVSPDSSAEKLTVFDVKDFDQRPVEDVFDDYTKKRRIEIILSKKSYSREERKLIRQYLGLGEYTGRRLKNLNQAALNSNMTYQQAQNVIKRLQNDLENE